jgi:hypothetical protein
MSDVLDMWSDAIVAARAAGHIEPGTAWGAIRALEAEVRRLRAMIAEVCQFTEGGLYEQAGHHKQWWLERIAGIVGMKQQDDDPWEKGIAP